MISSMLSKEVFYINAIPPARGTFVSSRFGKDPMMELPNDPTNFVILLAGASQEGSHFSPGSIDLELFHARGHDLVRKVTPDMAISRQIIDVELFRARGHDSVRKSPHAIRGSGNHSNLIRTAYWQAYQFV